MFTVFELAVLFGVLYVIHKSFRQITLTGFAISFIIAVFASMYMATYLHTQPLISLVIVIVLFPPLQILIKNAFKSTSVGATNNNSYVPVAQQMSEPYRPVIDSEADAVEDEEVGA